MQHATVPEPSDYPFFNTSHLCVTHCLDWLARIIIIVLVNWSLPVVRIIGTLIMNDIEFGNSLVQTLNYQSVKCLSTYGLS